MIKNAEEATRELAEVFENLKSGKTPPRTAKEMINAVGKMERVVKLQLAYRSQRNEKAEIKFLDCN